MLIPVYTSKRTYYQRHRDSDGLETVSVWAETDVESFEPIPASTDERFRCVEVVQASAEPSALVRVPAGTKLLTLEIPGSPVNPLVFAEIPHPKKRHAYLVRELPIGLVIAGRQRLYGCELATAPTVAEAAPEIDRTVVVVPPAVESRETPQVCEANQGSSEEPTDDQVEVVVEQLRELTTAEERIDAAIERARQLAWEEHLALARPSSPKAGRSKRVASGQGSLF